MTQETSKFCEYPNLGPKPLTDDLVNRWVDGEDIERYNELVHGLIVFFCWTKIRYECHAQKKHTSIQKTVHKIDGNQHVQGGAPPSDVNVGL